MIEERVMKLASTRPDMACIFQTRIKKYERFVLYQTYVVCYALSEIKSYKTTELKDDIMILDSNDEDLNKVIEEHGYDPKDNVIHAFFIENTSR